MSALVEGRKQAARIKERTAAHRYDWKWVDGMGWTDTNRASKSRSTLPGGCFTRQPVNLAGLQGLTKILPVRLPVRRRQVTRQVSSCSLHLMTSPPELKRKFDYHQKEAEAPALRPCLT